MQLYLCVWPNWLLDLMELLGTSGAILEDVTKSYLFGLHNFHIVNFSKFEKHVKF